VRPVAPTIASCKSAINWTVVGRTKLALLATVDEFITLAVQLCLQHDARETARRAGPSGTADTSLKQVLAKDAGSDVHEIIGPYLCLSPTGCTDRAGFSPKVREPRGQGGQLPTQL